MWFVVDVKETVHAIVVFMYIMFRFILKTKTILTIVVLIYIRLWFVVEAKETVHAIVVLKYIILRLVVEAKETVLGRKKPSSVLKKSLHIFQSW